MIVNEDFQVNHIRLRYVFKNGYYRPEYYSHEDEKYVGFHESKIDGKIREFVEYMAEMEKRTFDRIYFNNTKNLYFHTELCCLAFLGAARSYFEETIVNYKQLKLKQINK